jgi:hypothetical protein
MQEMESGQQEGGSRSSFKDANDEEDDEDDDGEVNVDEDETGDGIKKTLVNATTQPKISVSVVTKKHQAEEAEVPLLEKYDFTYLDELFSMLDSKLGGEDIEPILCGYFTKVVNALLSKLKSRLFPYLLLKREGDVFTKLVGVLQHHSLAQLLIELLQIKIGSAPPSKSGGASGGLLGRGGGFAFENRSDSEEEDKPEGEGEDEAAKLSPDEQRMLQVLNERR